MTMPLHHQIRAARERAGLSIADLARQAGVNRSWLQKLEYYGKNITVDSLRRIMAPLPQAQLVLHDGLSLGSAAESAEMARLLSRFVQTSELHALRVQTAADALQAMAATATDLTELAMEMEALWGRWRAGVGAEEN